LIEFIRGELSEVTSNYIVVENGGIGYLIFCPNPFSFQPIGQSMTVYTYQYVREDAINLYGFHSRDDRSLFVHLLSVSGIGPKGALAVLASGETERVVQAIESEDESFLIKFPGIGKKTARQMILDLKGKLKGFSSPAQPMQVADISKSKALDEALQALQALGYSEREIDKIVPKLKNEEMSPDQYIRKALQLMLKD
jgi:holliday junction DNA helicase RuvA